MNWNWPRISIIISIIFHLEWQVQQQQTLICEHHEHFCGTPSSQNVFRNSHYNKNFENQMYKRAVEISTWENCTFWQIIENICLKLKFGGCCILIENIIVIGNVLKKIQLN